MMYLIRAETAVRLGSVIKIIFLTNHRDTEKQVHCGGHLQTKLLIPLCASAPLRETKKCSSFTQKSAVKNHQIG